MGLRLWRSSRAGMSVQVEDEREEYTWCRPRSPVFTPQVFCHVIRVISQLNYSSGKNRLRKACPRSARASPSWTRRTFETDASCIALSSSSSPWPTTTRTKIHTPSLHTEEVIPICLVRARRHTNPIQAQRRSPTISRKTPSALNQVDQVCAIRRHHGPTSDHRPGALVYYACGERMREAGSGQG